MNTTLTTRRTATTHHTFSQMINFNSFGEYMFQVMPDIKCSQSFGKCCFL